MSQVDGRGPNEKAGIPAIRESRLFTVFGFSLEEEFSSGTVAGPSGPVNTGEKANQ